MGFTELIKKSVLEGFTSDITLITIITTLTFSAIIGIYIYYIYKLKTRTQFYSVDFNASLLILPVITAAIVLAIQSNFVISLGMVGALSIVRFRNAVKNTIDLMFLYFSISTGIIIGAGLYELGVVLSLFIGILVLVTDFLPNKKPSYVLVLNFEKNSSKDNYINLIKNNTKHFNIKSKTLRGDLLDVIIELRCKDTDKLLKDLKKIKSLKNINLLMQEGNIRI